MKDDRRNIIVVYLILAAFAVCYSILSIMRYAHFGAGYDLAIVDQIVWKYSQFQAPITTVHAIAYRSLLTDHVEIIYMLLSPLYWIWSDARILLAAQAVFISWSAYPVFAISRRRNIPFVLSLGLTVSYLMFYGVQYAIWADVHSIVFGAGLLAWLIYFLEFHQDRLALVCALLAVLCKENVAILTLAIGLVWVVATKRKVGLTLVIGSIAYLGIIFGIYFPYFSSVGYAYGSAVHIPALINPYLFVDSEPKRQVLLYSFLWVGFIPFLSPLFLLPFLADIYTYFVLANHIRAGHELVQHYRVALSVLLLWPTIIVIAKYRKLQSMWTAVYIFLCISIVQYALHLPLSYLVKRWFWEKPQAAFSIETLIRMLLPTAAVAAQNNITPHITQRADIVTVLPGTKQFEGDSPCGSKECRWLFWSGNPEYLIVDTSDTWDARHFLSKREEFLSGLVNMEKIAYIQELERIGNAIVYRVQKQP